MVTRSGTRRITVIGLIITAIVLGGIVSAYIALKPASSVSPPMSTPTPTPAHTSNPTPSPVPNATPSPSPTPTPSSTTTPSPSPTPTPAPSPTTTPAPTPTPMPTPSPSPSPSPETYVVNYTTIMEPGDNDYWNVSVTSPSYTVELNDSMTVSSVNQYLQVEGLTSTLSTTWVVSYLNSTYFEYYTFNNQGNQLSSGWLNCSNGIVYVEVNETAITFIGTTSVTSNLNFVNLGQIWTTNAGGNFTNGELDVTVTVKAA